MNASDTCKYVPVVMVLKQTKINSYGYTAIECTCIYLHC